MGFLGFGKKDNVVDLTERYERQQEKLAQAKSENQEQSASTNAFSFFDSGASSSESSNYVDVSEGVDDKKKKLAKRLADMTAKMEEISNQIYHLQQRLEVLERKSGVGSFG